MPLPFTLAGRMSNRSMLLAIASVNGEEVTTAKIGIGDAQARSKVAKAWASDRRLTNGTLVRTADVLAELDRLELQALDGIRQVEDEPEQPAGPPETEGASLVNDDFIAELAWNQETGVPDFIVYERASEQIVRRPALDIPAGKLVPPASWQGIVTPGTPVPGIVLLPTDADQTGTESDLRRDVRAFIDRYVELPGEAAVIAVEYVLLTWVFDAFDELPYLAGRTADCGRGKSRFLDTVGTLCRRPILIGGGSSAPAVLRLLSIYGGTLVADEFDQRKDSELSADLAKILNLGFQRNKPLVKCVGDSCKATPFYCFGPKVFALRQRLGDDATESRTLSIYMRQRTREDIPLNLPRAQFDAEALALRNRLLWWRFTHLGRVKIDPSLADPELEDRSNQIALPLLAVARAPAVRQTIVNALKEQAIAVAADRQNTLAGEVFAVLAEHYQPGDVVRPKEVTAWVNRARAEGSGVDLDHLRDVLTPVKVGNVLRLDLELPRASRGQKGVTYFLAPDRMMELSNRYGGPPVQPTQPTHLHPTPGTYTPRTAFSTTPSGFGAGCVGCVGSGEVAGDDVGSALDVGSTYTPDPHGGDSDPPVIEGPDPGCPVDEEPPAKLVEQQAESGEAETSWGPCLDN